MPRQVDWSRGGGGSSGRKAMLAVAVSVAAVVGIAACGGDDDDDDAAGEGSSDQVVQIADFVALQANPYEQSNIESAEETAAELNAEVTLFDGGNDPEKQVAQCQDAIASQRFDAFVLKAVAGPAMVPCAEQALEAGIEVVAVDIPLGQDPNSSEIQVDGIAGSVVHLARTNGEALAEMTGDACADLDPCEVIYLFGPPEFSYAAETRKAYTETVAADYPNVDILAEATTNFDPDLATSETRQLLQRHPDVNAIVSDADESIIGAERALENAGDVGDVALIGGGGSEEGAAEIEAGEWFGSSALFPRTMARTAVEMAVAAARGEDVGENALDVVADLSPIGTGAVTQENVDEFEAEWSNQ